MAIVTGARFLLLPEYSAMSSSVRLVFSSSSSRHCLAATVLVTKIRVLAFTSAIIAAPTMVLPAPQGSTTTPEPPSSNLSAASRWYPRSDQFCWLSSIG